MPVTLDPLTFLDIQQPIWSQTFDMGSITVDTLVDENDGDLSLGDISLREAIAFIKDGGTITFAPELTGTILLDPSLGQLVIDKSLTLEGPGADVITISGGNDQFRVFSVNDEQAMSSNVIISNLKISEGTDDGGGIQNFENLVLNDSVVSDNLGSGIENYNSIRINNSIITNNFSSVAGGGIRNVSGNIQIINTTISDNLSLFSGGGIAVIDGDLTVNDSVIDGNSLSLRFSEEGGGIAIVSGNATITDSTIRSNFSNGMGGGISSNAQSLVISNTHIADNAAVEGGGIAIFSDAIISDSVITNNNSGKDAGIDPFSGEPFDGSGGGGIALFGGADKEIISSTISGNEGGGILLDSTAINVWLTHSTITNNSANFEEPTNFEGNGVSSAGHLTVANSIIAANSHDSDVFGNVTSDGYNLIGNGSGSNGFGGIGDQVGTTDNPIDPRLAPLADNGGPTLTHALQPGSPAIDAGDPNFSPPPNTDQRGEPRVVDGNNDTIARIDIGAFEVQSIVLGELDIGIYDTDSDTLITQITEGATIQADLLADRNLTIAAIVPDNSAFAGKVESMFLNLNDGAFTQTENVEPYALFGDAPKGDFISGGLVLDDANTITFDLFDKNDLRGNRLGTVTRNFTVIEDQMGPTGLNVGLYDTDTDALIAPLQNGSVIEASVLADRNLTIAAVVPEDSIFADKVESMFLNLNDGEFTQIENVEPYALFGDVPKGDFIGGGLTLQGSNTITFDLYTKNGLRGDLIQTVSVEFEITNNLA